MQTKPPFLDTDELARIPEFERALQDMVDSGFGELTDAAIAPPPEPSAAPKLWSLSWWIDLGMPS